MVGEQRAYGRSLKYYRDLKNVIDSAERGGVVKGQRSLLLELGSHKLGEIPEDLWDQINQLSTDALVGLGKAIFELEDGAGLRRSLVL
jgi:hypothetical protein